MNTKSETKELLIPEGWKIKKVTKDKIILVEKKKELPKFWEDCAKMLKTAEYIDTVSQIKYIYCLNEETTNLLHNRNIVPIKTGLSILYLCMLLVCREVYRQGWKPDWTDNTAKYIIVAHDNVIQTDTSICTNFILSFQSPEIRDQFFKNFRDLIERAKELI